MTPAIQQRATHFERVRADLAAAHGAAMTNTVAAHHDAADIARAALAVAAKPTKTPAHSYLERMQSLIAAFGERNMSPSDVMIHLGISDSSARGHIKTLRIAGVIELAGHVGGTSSFPGAALFGLVPQPELAAAAFIESISAPRAVARSAKPVRPATPGRHIHLMGDDVPYSVRTWRGPAARDPWDVAFFGPARAEVRA